MNAILRTILFFGTFCTSNFLCAMDFKSIAVDPLPFHQLPPKALAQLYDTATLQGINKTCSKIFSIKNEGVFSQHFCDAIYEKSNGVDRMCAILFCAAYKNNLKGVENILKNSGLLDHYSDRNPFFYYPSGTKVKQPKILFDLYTIATQAGNNRLKSLLSKYGVGATSSFEQPTLVNMSCIEGNSDKIIQLLTTCPVPHEFDKMITLLIDLDYYKCLLRILAYNWPKGFLKIQEKHKKRAISGHNNPIVVDVLSLFLGSK